MKQIPIESVRRWASAGSKSMSYPASISTTCPKCGVKAVFSSTRRHYDAHRDTLSCSADCPACNMQTHIWVTNMVALDNKLEGDTAEIFMLPKAEERMNLKALNDVVPDGVLQKCMSTQEVHGTGNKTATSVMVQATLDTIFEDFLPTGNSNSTLSQLIRDSLPAIDLEQPLNTLSTSLRHKKHLHSLLKHNEQTSPETANTLLSLMECLITYLYVLPNQFKELDGKFRALSMELESESLQIQDESESERKAA